ncbi:Aminodeoxychorismate synthase [Cladobotryum mycophilum]|uniref:aminodeoxychorismate synthase n=1 Tax=Cladobotryum mycophilum TaxID=491253 RepID=A0ABR0SNM8_9HYPO
MPLLRTPSPSSPTIEDRSHPDEREVQHRYRRILFLDAYDSFTNNIVSLLKDALGHDVLIHVLHMDLKTLHSDPTPDWTPDEFLARLPGFDAVVCGPGPGSPLCDADVGVFRLLWSLPRERAVPVLGICLGFQSLVAYFGGGIRKLRRGLHGMDDVSEKAWKTKMWQSPTVAPDLIPLAWTLERGDLGDERILMGVRHAKLPFWGVQYHPESVCTDPAARTVLTNWFSQALKWNESTGRVVRYSTPSEYSDSLDPCRIIQQSITSERTLATRKWWRDMQFGIATSELTSTYHARQIKLPDGVDAADVAEVLGLGDVDTMILDSSSTVTGDPLARNSILALDVDKALRFEYHVGDNYVTLRRLGTLDRDEERQVIRIDDGKEHGPYDVWNVISEYWQRRRVPSEEKQEPAFKGGLMGFVTYEMGLGALSPGMVSMNRGHDRPDLCFAWVTKSIVLDHQAGVAYIQTMATSESDALSWIEDIADKVENSLAWQCPGSGTESYKPTSAKKRTNEELYRQVQESKGRLRFGTPNSEKYEDDVRQCQVAISEGHSYELCLTGQTTMTRPLGNDVPHHLRGSTIHGPYESKRENGLRSAEKSSKHGTPWELYRTLRAKQPAPFGSFIRLGGATIISSSPERFLTHDAKGLCSMRPMKGTVRKSEAVSTLAQAEKLLHIPKEEAENLMIVDLVRHDLHGVCGAGAVTVPDLLKVEEYASVFQMITVVNGQLPGDQQDQSSMNGLDVLAAALPPGSMTGAPKKRSCELLRVIEPTERSLYSGVVGYLDIKGQGDWSVTIRTMFRWDDETAPPEEGRLSRGKYGALVLEERSPR